MRWLVVLVLVLGWPVAAMTALPAPRSSWGVWSLGAAFSCLVSVVVGYSLGRSVRSTATATAAATAVASSASESTSTAQVVVNIADGARYVAAQELGGLDHAGWIDRSDAPVAIEQDHGLTEVDGAMMVADEEGAAG